VKSSPVPVRASLLACAVAVSAFSASAASAVEAPPTVLACEDVGAFSGRWLVSGEPLARVVVTGPVSALAAAGDRGFTTVCAPPAPRVVCVEQSVAGLSIGDVVTLEGVVASTDGAELILDPCGAILRE
jgi:hypothetical protein